MKWLHLIPAVLALCLITGCSTLQKSDVYLLQQHHVSAALSERMIHGEYLDLVDIIELSHRQLPPNFIVHYLWSTYGVYHLSAADISRLQKAGVNKVVIDYLKATPTMFYPRLYPGYSPGPPYDPFYYPYGYGYGYDYGYPPVFLEGGYGGYGRRFGPRGGRGGFGGPPHPGGHHWH
jgi:hypothetical protein